MATDPGGSRVMDALIEGPCTAKFKKKLLKKLQGYYATAASTPGGNFLVEKCYTYAVHPPPPSVFTLCFAWAAQVPFPNQTYT